MNLPSILIHEGSDRPMPTRVAGHALPDELPDARVLLTGLDGGVIAEAALWWRDTPMIDGVCVGTIGGFTAPDEALAELLLRTAETRLKQAGCTTIVGPMNGNTWRRYRLVTGSNGRGPFLLEPRNPETWPVWWRQAGFEELAHYSSSLVKLDGRPTVPPVVKERLERSGLVIRPLNLDCYEDELRAIHDVCLRSFSSNFLYTPLDLESFVTAYGKIRRSVDPDLVRIAERDGVPCGFVFCIRDLEADTRGEAPTLIVKTLAVDPESRSAGLGSLLVDEVHLIGFQKGYQGAIHALQHETNTSLKITSRHHGEVFRNYALLIKRL